MSIKPLGKKQYVKNEDWIETAAHIEEIVSRESIDTLAEWTVEKIKMTTAGKSAAYAWSGGKDSIVLGKLCSDAGIADCMIGICNLEYPAFMKWILENMPEKCEVINVGIDIDWLSKHQDMLFPRDSSKAGRWFSIVQHTAQRQYFKKHNKDIMILGRRKADGNYVGKGTNIYTEQDTALSPTGRTRIFSRIFTITNCLCRLFTIGRMDICAVLIHGRRDSGQDRSIMLGRKYTT